MVSQRTLLFCFIIVSFLSSCIPHQAHAAANLELDGQVHGNATATSTSVTLSTSHSNDVIVAFIADNFGPVVSITDTAGLTWQERARNVGIAGQYFEEEWYAIATSSLSSDVITITQTGSGCHLRRCLRCERREYEFAF